MQQNSLNFAPEWKTIYSAPRGKEILVYDPRMNSIEIRLCTILDDIKGCREIWKDRHGSYIFYSDDLMWLELPRSPKKKHKCISDETGFVCEENSFGHFYVVSGSDDFRVKFCPFCGEKG